MVQTMNKQETRTVPLNEKRCLTVNEFQIYMSIGRNNALKLIKKSHCGRKVGRKILVDRIAFEQWMDAMPGTRLL